MKRPRTAHMEIANAIAALVQALRESPGDDVTRAVLADALDEAVPAVQDGYRQRGPDVRRGEVPPWLRLCWQRLAPERFRTRGPLSGWEVFTQVGDFLERCDDPPGRWLPRWDHPGRGTIAGLDCLISEPYADPQDAPEIFRPLAEILPGCASGYTHRGSWHSGTVRAILFPPLVMPPSKRAVRDAKRPPC